MSGDHSEEARAKLQKLQVSLEEAQEELRDTEYDKWYDDQTDMLDNLADEVEDFWERIMNDLRKDINGSMDSLLQMVTDNPEAVARALDELGLGNALSIITTYNPDGTHTNSSIDYGGNSYESTYDETGTNVNNKFDTSIDNLDSASDDLKDTAEDLAKQTEEEAEAKRKAFEKEQAEKQKQIEKQEQIEKQAAYDRADSIMAQSVDGKNKLIADMEVPMSGIRAAVEEFLSSSALHKPATDAGKKRMKTDPLLKYIAKNYNGKTLSNVNEARLGAFFGIPVKDNNKVTKEEADKILKAFKDAGFAKGGIASTLNKAAKDNGDDGIITIQKGEAVLTKEETEAVKKIADRFIPVGPKITPEQERILMAHLGMPFDYSDMMPKYENAPVNNTNNTSVTVGDVNIHMDGTGIKDEKSFCDMITHSTMVQSAIDQSVGKGITKAYANTLGRF